MKNPLLLLLLSPLACAPMGAQRPASSPAISPHVQAPSSGLVTPEPPIPPVANSQGCVPTKAGYAFMRSYRSYLESAKTYEATTRGWKQLGGAFSKQHRSRERPLFGWGDLEEGPDLWLYLGETHAEDRLSQAYYEHYIDARGTVFAVSKQQDCGRTQEVRVCGSLPGDGGCGVENCGNPPPPPDLRAVWYVQAPKGSRLSSVKPTLSYKVPVCYDLRPENGFSYPP